MFFYQYLLMPLNALIIWLTNPVHMTLSLVTATTLVDNDPDSDKDNPDYISLSTNICVDNPDDDDDASVVRSDNYAGSDPISIIGVNNLENNN